MRVHTSNLFCVVKPNTGYQLIPSTFTCITDCKLHLNKHCIWLFLIFCFVHKWLSCLFGTGHRGFRVLAGQDADIEGVQWTDGWLVDRMRNKRTRCVSQIRKILFQHHSTTIGTNWHREGRMLVALSMGSRWTYSLRVCVAVCRIINAYLETSNRDRLCMLTRWQLAMSHQDCLYVTAYGHF